MTASVEVIAGILARSNDRIEWVAARSAAVVPVEMHTRGAVAVVVDAALTHCPLAWSIPATGPDQLLDDAVGMPGFTSSVRAAVGDHALDWDTPVLAAAWAHLAEVIAVRRWLPRPMNEAILELDQALAATQAGDCDALTRLLPMADTTLDDLVDYCRSDNRPSAVTERVVELLKATSTPERPSPYLAAIASLTIGNAVADETLIHALAQWGGYDADHQRSNIALHAGETQTTSTASDADLLGYAAIDPILVPARVFEWRGADVPELRLARTSDPDRVTLTARLAAHCDPFSEEAENLLAFATDAHSGHLISVSPMTVMNDLSALTAAMSCQGHPPANLRFGVTSADTLVDTTRTDLTGRTLVRADRLMLQAWAAVRHAATILQLAAPDPVALGTAEYAATALRQQARSDASAANYALRVLARDMDHADPRLVHLDARSDAIREFVNRKLTAPVSSVDALTLAELLPPQSADTAL